MYISVNDTTENSMKEKLTITSPLAFSTVFLILSMHPRQCSTTLKITVVTGGCPHSIKSNLKDSNKKQTM
jgi:hypothetical protein